MINLDKYFMDNYGTNYINELIELGVISKNLKDGNYLIKINNENYYFKFTNHLVYELLGSNLGNKMGINTVDYNVAIFNDKEGVISKSFYKDDEKYYPGTILLAKYFEKHPELKEELDNDTRYGKYRTLNVPLNNLNTIWRLVEEFYPNNGKNLMNDLVKRYLFYIMTFYADSESQNWGIIEGNNIKVSPVFDFESMFYIAKDETRMSIDISHTFSSFEDNLERFLKESSNEYIDMFLDMFSKFSYTNFIESISEVEDKVGKKISDFEKKRLINEFNACHKKIKDVLYKLGYIKSSTKIIDTDKLYDINKEGHFLIDIDNERYYFKKSNYFIREILGSKLAEYLNIDTVSYDIGVINRKLGVLSKYYRKEDYTYFDGEYLLNKYYLSDKDNYDLKYDNKDKMFMDMSNIIDLLNALKDYTSDENLVKEFLKRYIFNMIINNGDFGIHNFEFAQKDNEIVMCPMIDFERSFLDTDYFVIEANKDGNSSNVYEILDDFLNNDEYLFLFKEMFDKVNINIIEKYLKIMEIEYDIVINDNDKKMIINNFINHYNKVEDILNRHLNNNLKR